MRTILVQWTQRKTLNRLLQHHFGVFLVFCLPFDVVSNEICPSVMQNELSRPFVLSSSIILTFVKFHAEIFSNFSLSLSTVFAAGIFRELEAWEQISEPKSWCCSELFSFSCNMVLIMIRKRIHASFVLILLDASLPQFLIVFKNFAEHSRSHWCFQFLTSIPDGFLEFLILRVDEMDSSQFSCVFKMELFIRPLLLFLSFGMLSHWLPDFWPYMIWPGCKLFSR